MKSQMKKWLIIVIIFCILLISISGDPQPTTTKPSQSVPTATSEVTHIEPPEENPTVTPEPETSQPAIDLRVHFIDVGQGDSILIDLGETEVLIDGGGRSPGVVSHLANYIEGSLEVMVATHPHADHIEGLIEVSNTFDVEDIWHNGDTSTSKTYRDFMECVNSEGAEVHVARLHDTVIAGVLSLKVHHLI